MFAVLFYAAWLLAVASSHPFSRPKAPCPPFGNGTITIDSYQLYPENVDFDEQSCLLCKYLRRLDIGALYNASVVVYDPYEGSIVSTIEFSNITRTVPFHIGGVAWDPYASRGRGGRAGADEITILVDAAPAHETAGRDVSGDNYILRWDAAAGRVLWAANLTAVSGGRYGGPQDVEHDARGNVYVLGTYPGTLLRVSGGGGGGGGGVVVEEWYVPAAPDHEVVGYTGLAAADETTLLVADARGGGGGGGGGGSGGKGGALYRFDMGAARGVPTPVPIAYPSANDDDDDDDVIRPGDAIYLPPKYGREVLLIAEHGAGVSVLRSGTVVVAGKGGGGGWRSAEFLGRIPNPADVAASGGLVTAAVEIAGSVFMVEEWFTDALVPGTSAGNRTSFPLVDITAQLDALVKPR
ncbi:putative tri14-like protein [Rosellinia necatrix]|uniref:Putative tri14-like protein n=1 Tax=Rosellinia necatrix TaxID=77044 RepID=A0A1W2TBX0_ROSNE|nr:putative tri14-like protein [Rosellinia necatrix]